MTSTDKNTPIKQGWSYQHKIGVISVESWGKPFLTVSENKYWNGESWGYNYFKLGAQFQTEAQALAEADKLNKEYELPQFYNSQGSELLLLSLQDRFPEAQIKKPNTKTL